MDKKKLIGIILLIVGGLIFTAIKMLFIAQSMLIGIRDEMREKLTIGRQADNTRQTDSESENEWKNSRLERLSITSPLILLENPKYFDLDDGAGVGRISLMIDLRNSISGILMHIKFQTDVSELDGEQVYWLLREITENTETDLLDFSSSLKVSYYTDPRDANVLTSEGVFMVNKETNQLGITRTFSKFYNGNQIYTVRFTALNDDLETEQLLDKIMGTIRIE